MRLLAVINNLPGGSVPGALIIDARTMEIVHGEPVGVDWILAEVQHLASD